MDISNDILMDELFFIGNSDAIELQRELCEATEIFGFTVTFTEFPQENPHRKAEAIAITGLAISALATMISLLSYFDGKKKNPTMKEIHDEIQSYLALKGISDYKILSSYGLEGLFDGSEESCTITFAYPHGEEGKVFIGIRDKHIWVSNKTPSIWRLDTNS